MENLLLCSRTLYDKDILDKMSILQAKTKAVKKNYPQLFFETYTEWDEKKNLILNGIKTYIVDYITNEDTEYEIMRNTGLTSHQWVNVGNNVEKNLYYLTADKKWSHDVTWELMSLCSLFFDSLISSGTWEILYERLTRNQIASLLNNIIKNHLDNDILLDIPKFRCKNCKKISSNVFASDNYCFECKFVIANS